jgi:hypothetical protein
LKVTNVATSPLTSPLITTPSAQDAPLPGPPEERVSLSLSDIPIAPMAFGSRQAVRRTECGGRGAQTGGQGRNKVNKLRASPIIKGVPHYHM